MVLGHIIRTAWGTKLLLTAVWASLVDCISLCQLLKLQHHSLSLNGYFDPLPIHPTIFPSAPPPIDSMSDSTGTEKTISKSSSI